MTEEPSDKKLLSLAEAAKELPRVSGRKASTNAIWRWCRKGIKSRSGQRIHLEHVRLGGKLYTTAEWVVALGKKLMVPKIEHRLNTTPGVAARQQYLQSYGQKP